jgi:hypothetical protein
MSQEKHKTNNPPVAFTVEFSGELGLTLPIAQVLD